MSSDVLPQVTPTLADRIRLRRDHSSLYHSPAQDDLPREAPPVSYHAGVHVALPALECLGGFHWRKCSCGARSLPAVRPQELLEWVCPIGEAESFAQTAQRLYERAIAEAQFSERIER